MEREELEDLAYLLRSQVSLMCRHIEAIPIAPLMSHLMDGNSLLHNGLYVHLLHRGTPLNKHVQDDYTLISPILTLQ